MIYLRDEKYMVSVEYEVLVLRDVLARLRSDIQILGDLNILINMY